MEWARAERRTWRYRLDRAALLADGPLCAHGCGRLATVADHQPPLALFHCKAEWLAAGGHYVPSCKPCSDSQGGRIGGPRRHQAKLPAPSRAW